MRRSSEVTVWVLCVFILLQLGPTPSHTSLERICGGWEMGRHLLHLSSWWCHMEDVLHVPSWSETYPTSLTQTAVVSLIYSLSWAGWAELMWIEETIMESKQLLVSVANPTCCRFSGHNTTLQFIWSSLTWMLKELQFKKDGSPFISVLLVTKQCDRYSY